MGLPQAALRKAEQFMQALQQLFLARDCSLLEINPLVLTADNRLLALDAKMSFDDNALFRHPDLTALRDLAEEEPAEIRAGEAGLSFVKLDGNIGCLVNGAGLAMSTMDLIKLHGGEPANFLDVGGGANVQQVTEAFRILVGRSQACKAVLVNIFGGIMRCTTIAGALLEAHRSVDFKSRWSCGWKGPRSRKAAGCWPRASWTSFPRHGLTDAAKKVVAAAGKA